MNNVIHTRPLLDRSLWLTEEDASALAQGTHRDPFAILGIHSDGKGQFLRVFLPGAVGVDVLDRDGGSVRCCLTACKSLVYSLPDYLMRLPICCVFAGPKANS